MNALPEIAQSMQNGIGFVDFNEGHRYQDFIPGADKKAAYGVAGLIVGAVAAKAGFFKLLWVGILAFKKLIVAAVAAVGLDAPGIRQEAAPTGAGFAADHGVTLSIWASPERLLGVHRLFTLFGRSHEVPVPDL
jgi:Protein of unknown function (DUF2167)